MIRRVGSLTLTQRLLLLSAVAVAPAFLILLYNLVVMREIREAEVHDAALQTGRIAALEMERIIYGSEDVLRAMATAPTVAGLAADCNAYLAELDGQIDRFSTLRVLGLDGAILCTSETELTAVSFEDRQYFRDALATGSFVVGEFTLDRIDGHRVLPLALPTANAAGRIDRVVVGTLDLDWLGRRIRERDFSKNGALTVADRNGIILAREPFPERFVGTRISGEFIHLVTAERAGTISVEGGRDQTDRIIGYIPVGETPRGLYVGAGISRDEVFAPIEEATLGGLTLALAGLAAAFSFAVLTGRALVRRPVDRIVRTIAAWRRGDETARTGMTEAEAELGVVARAIDGYMDELVVDRKLRRQAEAHRELLLREMDHRVKNILATVQAVARQTFRSDADPAHAMDAYSARLAAIADAHALLVSNAWQSTDIGDVMRSATGPFRGESERRFEISGPELRIGARSALALSMAVHELCTNSVKYGALGRDEGRVSIDWTIEDTGDDARLVLVWQEKDGPPVRPPERKGFGSRMIERLLAAEISADIRLAYEPAGVVCTVSAPVEAILAGMSGDAVEANPARRTEPATVA